MNKTERLARIIANAHNQKVPTARRQDFRSMLTSAQYNPECPTVIRYTPGGNPEVVGTLDTSAPVPAAGLFSWQETFESIWATAPVTMPTSDMLAVIHADPTLGAHRIKYAYLMGHANIRFSNLENCAVYFRDGLPLEWSSVHVHGESSADREDMYALDSGDYTANDWFVFRLADMEALLPCLSQESRDLRTNGFAAAMKIAAVPSAKTATGVLFPSMITPNMKEVAGDMHPTESASTRAIRDLA